MTRAYNEIYVDDAMECLGGAMEYAVLIAKRDGQEFTDLFISSGIADEFGRGNVKYISGMSGIELARLVFKKCGIDAPAKTETEHIDYPCEYWVGWILAYYQWYTGKSFRNICRKLRYEDLCNLYGVLHEADLSKAVSVFDNIMASAKETNLARLRCKKGLTQSELAALAGVSVRSIQLYEQRQTDINKAQYNNLRAIAGVLGCDVEDLSE